MATQASQANIPSVETLIERADAIGRRAAELAREAERRQRIDDEIVEAFHTSGLMKVLQPRHWGGWEIGFPAFVRIIETMARHDASAAWVYGIHEIHHWWAALVEPELQEELWGDNPDRVFVDSFAPMAKVQVVDGGYRISGAWRFVSGVWWGEWCAVGGLVPVEGGPPDYRMFFMPRKDYRIIDDWDVVGLRGSASCTVACEDVFIPEYRAFRMGYFAETGIAPGHALNPSPLYKTPAVGALGSALIPESLGAAQGMLARFRERMRERVPLFNRLGQADTATGQRLLGEATVSLDAVQKVLYAYADEVQAAGERGGPPPLELRAKLFGWRAYIAGESRRVGHRLFEESGAHAVYMDEPLQRAWRDLYTMAQHLAVNYDVGMRNYGKVQLGMEPDVQFL